MSFIKTLSLTVVFAALFVYAPSAHAALVVTPDTPAITVSATPGIFYLKGGYVNTVEGAAPPLPEGFLYVWYGHDPAFVAGSYEASMGATLTPIAGYDLAYTGRFTISLSLPLSDDPYYFKFVDGGVGTYGTVGPYTTEVDAFDAPLTDEEGDTTAASDNTYTLLAPLPIQGNGDLTTSINIGPNDGPGGNFDFGDYINGLLTFAIGIAGALAVVMIVVGGIQYMSTDNFGEKMQGKEHIKNSLGGLILLIGAYMILNTINPNLVDFNFSIEKVSIEADPIFILEHSDENAAPVAGKECNGKYEVGSSWFDDTGMRFGSFFTASTPETDTDDMLDDQMDEAPDGMFM